MRNACARLEPHILHVKNCIEFDTTSKPAAINCMLQVLRDAVKIWFYILDSNFFDTTYHLFVPLQWVTVRVTREVSYICSCTALLLIKVWRKCLHCVG